MNIEGKDKNGKPFRVGDLVVDKTRFGRVKSLDDPWAIDVCWVVIECLPNGNPYVTDSRLIEKLDDEQAMIRLLEL